MGNCTSQIPKENDYECITQCPDDTTFVIGANHCGELGLNHTRRVSKLVSWNQINKNIEIKQNKEIITQNVEYIDNNFSQQMTPK